MLDVPAAAVPAAPRGSFQAQGAPSLAGGARVDVCIIGASVAGLVAAYLLARQHRSVMVIDEGSVGSGYAGPDAVHLCSQLEVSHARLEALHGVEGARVSAQSHAAAIDAVEAIVRRERISCDFERLDAYLFGGENGREILEHEVECARRAGVRGVEIPRTSPIEGFESRPLLRLPGQAQIHPGRFLAGLAKAVAREGGRIHCGVRIRDLHVGHPSVFFTAAGQRIDASAVVMPVARTPATRTAVIGVRVPRGAVTRSLYWDLDGPSRCARLRSHGTGFDQVLLVAGALAADGDLGAEHAALEAWTRERFPAAGEIVQRMVSELPPADDLFVHQARSAEDSESTYVTTAQWGTAMTRGALSGMVVKDFLEGAAR